MTCCTREYCLLMKVSPPPPSSFLQHLAPQAAAIAVAVFSGRIHKVCSRSTALELQEDVLRLKLCVFWRGLITEEGLVHVFPPVRNSCSLHPLAGSSDSVPIAVWVFKLLCEISARILSSVPSLPLALCFPFDLVRATVPAPWSPGEVCRWFAVGSARVGLGYIAGCVTGQMASLCLGLFCAFLSYLWASFPFFGCYE